MAKANMLSEDEMKHELKLQFDGCHFSPAMTDVYNPFCILNALKYKIIENYWFRTGGYAREYAADKRRIHEIGCNFSSKIGTIDGWKVK